MDNEELSNRIRELSEDIETMKMLGDDDSSRLALLRELEAEKMWRIRQDERRLERWIEAANAHNATFGKAT